MEKRGGQCLRDVINFLCEDTSRLLPAEQARLMDCVDAIISPKERPKSLAFLLEKLLLLLKLEIAEFASDAWWGTSERRRLMVPIIIVAIIPRRNT